MNLTFSNNKLQSTLCILLSALPISLLSGSLIINLLTILILITFLLEILIKKRLDFLNDWSFYLLLFLWASFIINLFFSQDKSLSFFRTIGFVRFIFLAQAIRYVFLLNDNNYKIFILRIWAIIFIIVSFDLLLEYFNGINILGYKSNLEGRLASFLGEELKIGGYYFGFALIFLATINGFLKKDYKIIFLLSIIILNVSFLIGERSNFIKVLISIFIILIIFLKEHKIKIFSLILICILTFVIIINKNNDLKYRYLSQWSNKNISENIYFTHYETAILVFKKYPIFGSGIKNFRIEIREIINKDFKENEKYNNWQVITTHPHQLNFEILAETGIFGYSCFLLFFFISFFKSFRKIFKKNDLLFLSSTIFCLVYINPILPSGSFFTTFAATIFWTNYGIMISYLNLKKKIY